MFYLCKGFSSDAAIKAELKVIFATNIKNKMEDKRTFEEIFRSLTPEQKKKLFKSIAKKTSNTSSSVTKWGYGVMTPRPMARKVICSVLKILFKIETTPEALFPEK